MEFLRKLVEIIIKKHRQLKRLYRTEFALACIVVFVTSYALTLPAVTLDRETAEASAGIGGFEVQGQASQESGESGGSMEEDQSEADAWSQEESEADAGPDGEEAAETESAAAEGTDRESAAAEGTDRESTDPQDPGGAADAGTAGTQTAPVPEPEGTLLPEGTVLHARKARYMRARRWRSARSRKKAMKRSTSAILTGRRKNSEGNTTGTRAYPSRSSMTSASSIRGRRLNLPAMSA